MASKRLSLMDLTGGQLGEALSHWLSSFALFPIPSLLLTVIGFLIKIILHELFASDHAFGGGKNTGYTDSSQKNSAWIIIDWSILNIWKFVNLIAIVKRKEGIPLPKKPSLSFATIESEYYAKSHKCTWLLKHSVIFSASLCQTEFQGDQVPLSQKA